jgi:hypothetical protein
VDCLGLFGCVCVCVCVCVCACVSVYVCVSLSLSVTDLVGALVVGLGAEREARVVDSSGGEGQCLRLTAVCEREPQVPEDAPHHRLQQVERPAVFFFPISSVEV